MELDTIPISLRSVSSLTLAAIAGQRGFPRPACGYRMHTFDSLRRLTRKRDSSHFNEIAEMLASTFFTEGAPANPLDLSRFSRCVNPITAGGAREAGQARGVDRAMARCLPRHAGLAAAGALAD